MKFFDKPPIQIRYLADRKFSAAHKVIYDTTPPEKMIGFVLPNKGSKADLRTFAVTVDRVEELTGLDFFSTVPRSKQEQLERTITVESWDWIR